MLADTRLGRATAVEVTSEASQPRGPVEGTPRQECVDSPSVKGLDEGVITPKVSVCIPVYNSVDTIERCIESVLAQTYPNFECLVIDDHSVDGTAEAVAAFTDPRVRLVRNDTNLGMIGNHNKCLRIARGDLIQFVGGDDWLLPQCLESLVPAFESPNVGMAFARRRVETTNTWWKEHYGILDGPLQPLSPVNQGRDLVRKYLTAGGNGNPIGEPTTVMLRRETLFAAGGLPPEVPQLSDIDTWLRVLCRSEAAFVEKELSVRWHHAGSATDQFAGTTTLDKLWVLSSLIRSDTLGSALRLWAFAIWLRTLAALPKMMLQTPRELRSKRFGSFKANLRYVGKGRRIRLKELTLTSGSSTRAAASRRTALPENHTRPSQGVHVDPTLNPLPTRAWHPDIAVALESPEMATYRSVLTVGDQDVRTSILQELSEYHGYSADECLKRCLHWEDWSVEEWAAADRSTPEGIQEFYQSVQSWAFDLMWYAYLQSTGDGYPASVIAARFARNMGTGRDHLDFGSGTGTTAQLFMRLGFRTTLADISDPLLKYAAWRMERHGELAPQIHLTAEELPTDAYDVITALDTLVHVTDFDATARDLHRAVRRGGYLLANFDIRRDGDHGSQWHLYHDIYDIEHRLRAAGFVRTHTFAGITSCYRAVDPTRATFKLAMAADTAGVQLKRAKDRSRAKLGAARRSLRKMLRGS
ncbi:glycosyltransferase [Candidatus Mycolicibacterium alkanivorans]|uniref:Glycosyltransferase n=1 Tax=Candidatus Mycolicibacterium alkanivorans TaxID=2954114 RepID=A0ABS9YYV8_9MYCO|nr:glycosyltransferase [Candidatus Mycolicibacterium alkanivorans]MCI4675903.1 glycosyltransferase [Candidatus Mycolicibacterium alkanivorans]